MTPNQEYREILLTQGQIARVSPHRFEELSQFSWQAHWCPYTKSFYAARAEKMANGKRRKVAMHRQILGLEAGDKREGDHRNHDTLDNMDDNLRVATHHQNTRNSRMRSDNKSGYRGVFRLRKRPEWHAQIFVNGKNRYLGCRSTPERAYYELYVPAAVEHHGEFANLE